MANKKFDYKDFEKDYIDKLKLNSNSIKFIVISFVIYFVTFFITCILKFNTSLINFILMLIISATYIFVVYTYAYIKSDFKHKYKFWEIHKMNKDMEIYKSALLFAIKNNDADALYKLNQINNHYKYIYPEKERLSVFDIVTVIYSIFVGLISSMQFSPEGTIINGTTSEISIAMQIFTLFIIIMSVVYFQMIKKIIIWINNKSVTKEDDLRKIPVLLDEIIINYKIYFNKTKKMD